MIRRSGFQTVRINLHGLRYVEGDRIEPAWLATLDWAVEGALAAGLMVILGLHDFTKVAEDPAGFKPRILTSWRVISHRYREAPSELVFELLNEPNGRLTPTLWNEYLAVVAAATRPAGLRAAQVAADTSDLGLGGSSAAPAPCPAAPSKQCRRGTGRGNLPRPMPP